MVHPVIWVRVIEIKPFFIVLTDKNHLHVNFWHYDHLVYSGSFHKMLYLSVILFLVASLNHQEYLLWKSDIFWYQHHSTILYYGGFYDATAPSHKRPSKLLIHTLHRFLNEWDWCLELDFWRSETGAWSFSAFFHSYYGLSVWFPDVIKHLQSDEYASRVKHFRNEEVSHFVFNFTLENQIHTNGEYINDRFRGFLISWLNLE